jgi:hypothetical protein
LASAMSARIDCAAHKQKSTEHVATLQESIE